MEKDPAGLALIEWLIVAAVIAMAVGVLAPGFSARLQQARVGAAERDVETIGRGIDRFYRDLKVWPARNSGGVSDGLHVLFSGSTLPASNPYGSSGFWSLAAAGRADLLSHHLFENRPQGSTASPYPASGFVAWHGAYVDPVGLDPWGRPYLVNVIAGHSTSATNHRRLWVLSAGADGLFQTSSTAGLGDACLGDDIGFLVRLR